MAIATFSFLLQSTGRTARHGSELEHELNLKNVSIPTKHASVNLWFKKFSACQGTGGKYSNVWLDRDYCLHPLAAWATYELPAWPLEITRNNEFRVQNCSDDEAIGTRNFELGQSDI
jgi:hypothetical protein